MIQAKVFSICLNESIMGLPVAPFPQCHVELLERPMSISHLNHIGPGLYEDDRLCLYHQGTSSAVLTWNASQHSTLNSQ